MNPALRCSIDVIASEHRVHVPLICCSLDTCVVVEVQEYSQKMQTELDKLRGKIDDSADEQKRQAALLEQVNETVQPFGTQLESVRYLQ